MTAQDRLVVFMAGAMAGIMARANTMAGSAHRPDSQAELAMRAAKEMEKVYQREVGSAALGLLVEGGDIYWPVDKIVDECNRRYGVRFITEELVRAAAGTLELEWDMREGKDQLYVSCLADEQARKLMVRIGMVYAETIKQRRPQ